MAATVVVSEKFSTGNLRCVIGTITLDSSYPENGYPITAASISDGYLQDLKFLDIARYSVGFTPFWNESLSTIEVSAITGIPALTSTAIRSAIGPRPPSSFTACAPLSFMMRMAELSAPLLLP